MDAEIFLIGGDLSLAANDVGTLTCIVSPGIYKIRVLRAGRSIEELIELSADSDEHREIRIENLQTIAPTSAVLGDDALAFGDYIAEVNANAALREGAVRVQSRAPKLLDGIPQPVFIFASKHGQTPYSLMSGIRLFPWRATDLAVKLASASAGLRPAGVRIWQGARLELAPGTYIIEIPSGERSIRHVIPVFRGNETHVFIHHRETDPSAPRDNPSAMAADVAVQSRAREYWFSDVKLGTPLHQGSWYAYCSKTRDLEMEYSARWALASRRRIALADELVRRLLNMDFGDPLSGLAGAHLMFDTIETRKQRLAENRDLGTVSRAHFDDNAIESVLNGVSQLMRQFDESGHPTSEPPKNPDLLALHLRAGRSWDVPARVDEPPLFWPSWEALTAPHNRDNVEISPSMWSDTKLNGAFGPYFGWEPHRQSLRDFVRSYAAVEAVFPTRQVQLPLDHNQDALPEAFGGLFGGAQFPSPSEPDKLALQSLAEQLNIPNNVAKKLL